MSSSGMEAHSFIVHADILKQCKSREQRERIKWFHARRVFFDMKAYGDGLRLARQCEDDEAQFLVSLFPGGVPATKALAVAGFLSHSQDARCLCWASLCGAKPREGLMLQSAELGYAWAQVCYGKRQIFDDDGMSQWLEKAASQGDPDGKVWLAALLSKSREEGNMLRTKQLIWEAALLGDPFAQFRVSQNCPTGSLEQFAWLRRSIIQNALRRPLLDLLKLVPAQLDVFDNGGSGRIVFEVGAAIAGAFTWREKASTAIAIIAGKRAEELFRQWTREAKAAVLCWIWIAKSFGVAKDIRLLVADLIWDERAAWSERRGVAAGAPSM